MTEQINPYGRESWGPGPWDDEPDKEVWSDPDTGLPCAVVRNPVGAWCGYVGVPPGHIDHGAGYDDVPDVDVHCGLTFAGTREGPNKTYWFLGFDCAHMDDLAPAIAAIMKEARKRSPAVPPLSILPEPTYKTIGFAKNECTKLAAQLIRR